MGDFGGSRSWRLGLVVLASALGLIAASGSVEAQPAVGERPAPPFEVGAVTRLVRPAPPMTAREKIARETWRLGLVARPAASRGCFTAIYPDTQWRAIPCSPPALRPAPPAAGVRPATIGNRNDFSAVVTGSLTSAEGKFDDISGLTSENSIDTSGHSTANTYMLQVNSNTFSGPHCAHADVPANCSGWQQFVFSNTSGMFIQYWLIRYSATCPSGYASFTNTNGDLDCFRNGSNGISIGAAPLKIPQQTLSNLQNLTLTASAGQGTVKDSFVFSDGSQAWTDNEDNSILGLNTAWTTAEFNVFGDCCDATAAFNSGTSIVVRTTVHNGTTNAPTCLTEGFTGETNNLNLVSNPAIPVQPAPAIVFTESTSTGTAACATATSTGDTHLGTFDNVFYDFQAFGDFTLVDAGDFGVQTRQAPAPSNYPGTAVNKAVAVRMGANRIVVAMDPTELIVNGAAQSLGDGRTLSLRGDVFVTRNGADYFIRDRAGDAVRADVAPSWINVTVGLSRAPHASARGLLQNPSGAANTILAQDGVAMRKPFDFNELYHHYADSWRVAPQQSLFVNRPPAVVGIPAKAIYARDLDPADRAKARAVCVNRGVTGETLIDACTLDTAVLKDGEAASRPFLRILPPRLELRVLPAVAQRTP